LDLERNKNNLLNFDNIDAAINDEEHNYTIEEFFDENIFKKKAYKKHVYKGKVKEGEEESSFESEPSETMKIARKEGLEAIKALADISELKEEAPIQTPKKAVTTKAVTKKVKGKVGGKKVTRRNR
jgi:hypothetical protein